MSAFSTYLDKATGTGPAFERAKPAAPTTRPAARVVMLPVSAWAADWPEKHAGPVRIGLRLPAAGDTTFARAEAARLACELHPEESDEEGRIEAFNDLVVRLVLARSTCQPQDASRPFWVAADENIQLALTDSGIRLLWEELELLKAETDPLTAGASDEALERLAVRLATGAFGGIEPARALRARRLLGRALELLTSEN